MRTGKLSISRGYEAGETLPAAPRLVLVPKEAAPPPPARKAAPAVAVTPEYQPTHDRLAALERLARLAKQGMLTEEEFALEKARILGHHRDELVLDRPAPPPGPSLAGRLFDWRLIPVGLAAGLGLSFAAQPQQTIRFFDESLRLLGL